MPNCDITFRWLMLKHSGYHEHHTARPPGRFETEKGVAAGFIGPGRDPGGGEATLTANSGPSGIIKGTYTAAEASGTLELTVTGIAVVDGRVVHFGPDEYRYNVCIEGLERISGAGLDVNHASNMHGNNNGYVTAATATALRTMAQFFATELQKSCLPPTCTPPVTVPEVRITAASLPQGGLFDFKNEWAPPHVTHRFGEFVDIGIREFGRSQRKTLQGALKDAGFIFPWWKESPLYPAATHWHACLPTHHRCQP